MAQSRTQTSNFIFDFFAGGISGVIAKTLCAPVERIKLLMQTQSMNTKLKTPYKGIIDCFLRCLREDELQPKGVIALWRGNGVNIIRYFPTQALNFSFKDFFAHQFNAHNMALGKQRLFFNNIISGGCAGALTMSFVYPLDLARTRIGVDLGRGLEQRQFKGLADVLGKIYAKDSIRGLYQGIGICLFGIFIYRGLYFGLYDTGKEVVGKSLRDSYVARFFFAQSVVIFSETLSYPTDTLKRRLMMQSGGSRQYSGALQLFQHIRKNEGLASLMRGNASNIVRSIGSSLCLVFYDEIKKFQDYNGKKIS